MSIFLFAVLRKSKFIIRHVTDQNAVPLSFHNFGHHMSGNMPGTGDIKGKKGHSLFQKEYVSETGTCTDGYSILW